MPNTIFTNPWCINDTALSEVFGVEWQQSTGRRGVLTELRVLRNDIDALSRVRQKGID